MDSLTKGKTEGRTEGRIEGQHEDIMTILTGRFGAVPASLQQQVTGVTDLAQLRALVLQAATALTLEEFSASLQVR